MELSLLHNRVVPKFEWEFILCSCFALQAKFFTESRLLQREVKVVLEGKKSSLYFCVSNGPLLLSLVCSYEIENMLNHM